MRGTDPPLHTLPSGGLVTVSELREMASRQQQQIESQQQLLVAREQRLKYLRLHESKAKQATLEAERLRRLRERVEAQEAKLRRLRALRGQVDSSVISAKSLSNDLDAMRSLFSEKEKELTDAAAKVDQLTRQLEDVREGRANPAPNLNNNSIHHQELDKLRRELLYRNSVNREACARVASQQEALSARKDEVARIDKRIAELHQRLQRKRVLNHQLASQISAATQAKQAQLKAVQRKAVREASRETSADDIRTENQKMSEDVVEFERGNLDPKYQTLPYNTKFSSANKSRLGNEMNLDYDGNKNDNEQFSNNAQLTFKNTMKNAQEIFRSQDEKNKTDISPSDLNGNKKFEQYNNEVGHQNFVGKVSEAGNYNMNSQQNGNMRSAEQHYAEMSSHKGGDSSSSVVRTVHSIPMNPPSRGLASGPMLSAVNSGIPSNASSGLPPSENNFVPSIVSVANSHSVQTGKATTVRSQNIYRGKNYPNEPPPISNMNQQQGDLQGPLPPTSLSVSFAHKNIKNANVGLQQQQSNRPMTLSAAHYAQQAALKDVENVRALGYPAGSLVSNEEIDQNQRVMSGSIDGKPSLPPKPAVPTKPTPPPRQKGDPLLGSNESLNSSGKGINAVRTQLFNYASQNAIVSTYTHDPPSPRTTSAPSNISDKAVSHLNQDMGSSSQDKVHISINRRIEMPPDFMFPEDETPPLDLLGMQQGQVNKHKRKMDDNGGNEELMKDMGIGSDVTDKVVLPAAPSLMEQENRELALHLAADSEKRLRLEASNVIDLHTIDVMSGNENGVSQDSLPDYDSHIQQDIESNVVPTVVTTGAVRRLKKTNLKSGLSNQGGANRISRRVSFDPLALLLDASLEGELDLVKRTAGEVNNPSQANDEGITALHNAICAGHLDIVTFLVTFGCDVNAQDSDGWTPLHCAASCNNVSMVRFLVEHGACVLATTLSDHETAAEKCEQDEEGYDGCSQYLYSVQEKLGIVNGGIVYSVYDYESQNEDELTFNIGDVIVILRRGDEYERDWWWGKRQDESGYVPRNLLGLYPRVKNPFKSL